MITVKHSMVDEVCRSVFDMVRSGALIIREHSIEIFGWEIEFDDSPIPETSVEDGFVRFKWKNARVNVSLLPRATDPVLKHIDVYPTHAVGQLSYGQQVVFKGK